MTGDPIEIVEAGPDDLATYAQLTFHGFLDRHRPGPAARDRLLRQRADCLLRLARIGSVECGVSRSWDTDLPVPGARTVPIRAIGALTVLTTHRRRGVASALVRTDLAQARDRGAVLSLLIPSEAPIYGRFGFGAATETMRLTVDTRRLRFATPAGPGIELEVVEAAALRRIAPALYQDVAGHQPGALPRTELYWDRVCGLLDDAEPDRHRPSVIARAADGSVIGTASYRIQGDWSLDEHAGVELLDLTAANPAAYQALWQYLADIGLTDRIVAADRPAHEPLPWMLTDRRAVGQSHRTDFQWIRLLDVPAALTGRAASAPGTVVVEVHDPDGYGAGRWRVEADPDGWIQVTPTSASPGLTLPIQTLGAVYLGESSLTGLFRAGQADEHRPGAVHRLDRMLSWSPTAAVSWTWF